MTSTPSEDEPQSYPADSFALLEDLARYFEYCSQYAEGLGKTPGLRKAEVAVCQREEWTWRAAADILRATAQMRLSPPEITPSLN